MSNNDSVKLLWVDDQIDGYGPYVEQLKLAGFDVQTATSSEQALCLAKQDQFSIVIADILMPPPDGIELLRLIKPLQKNAVLGILSSYLYLDKFRDQLRNLDFPVEIIEKDFPNVVSDEFVQRFINPIKSLLKNGVINTIEIQDDALRQPFDTDPFQIPLSEFLLKPILEKDRLSTIAKKIAKRILDKEFRDGKIWVLLCGSNKIVRASARNTDEVLSDDQIKEYARSQKRAPFHFYAPIDSDDIWSNCGSSAYLDNYPTVTMEIAENELIAHFDTGSPITFFSYEELVKIGKITPTTLFALSERAGKPYWATLLDVEVVLKCQRNGQKKSIRLKGQIVRDWLFSPYMRRCSESCNSKSLKSEFNESDSCPERIALVGRNILTDNRISIILDGTNKKTCIE